MSNAKPARLSVTMATIALSALADRAEIEEARIMAAFKRLQAGDAEAEAEADAAQARLERLIEDMASIEAQMVGSCGKREVADFLAA